MDGAFIADQADDGAGAVLRRIFNINNEPLFTRPELAMDFRYLARVTIIDGCEAELQFRITDWGAGGCASRPAPPAAVATTADRQPSGSTVTSQPGDLCRWPGQPSAQENLSSAAPMTWKSEYVAKRSPSSSTATQCSNTTTLTLSGRFLDSSP